jgi:hypothetical protein
MIVTPILIMFALPLTDELQTDWYKPQGKRQWPGVRVELSDS